MKQIGSTMIFTTHTRTGNGSTGMFIIADPDLSSSECRHLHFYNNHDQFRIAGSAVPDGLRKTDLASAIIAFWPGIPLFYYGDEQGFNTPGTALDGWAREDFMTSLAWQKSGECCSGSSSSHCNPANKDNFDQTNPHFLHVQKLMNVRRLYPVLHACDSIYERWHQTNFMNGIYGYTRACGEDESTFALILFNTWREALLIPRKQMYSGWSHRREIVNVMGQYMMINDEMAPVETAVVDDHGFVQEDILLDPYEVKVFVAKDALKQLNPTVVSLSPQHDAVIDVKALTALDFQIVLHFSQPMESQSVSDAFTLDGRSLHDDKIFNLSNDGRSATFTIPRSALTEGVHEIGLKISARSSLESHLPLQAAFRSRFRIGSTDTNVIMNPCLNFQKMDMVVPSRKRRIDNNGLNMTCTSKKGGWGLPDKLIHITNPISFKLRHYAHGAALLRVRFGSLGGSHTQYHFKESMHTMDDHEVGSIQGPWSAWMPYANITTHQLSLEILAETCTEDYASNISMMGELPLLIQYWVDGSSAYFVTAVLPLQ